MPGLAEMKKLPLPGGHTMVMSGGSWHMSHMSLGACGVRTGEG